MRMNTLIIVGILSVILATGCDRQAKSVAYPVRATADQLALVKDGTQMISPVSNKSITKSPKTPGLVYRDKLYLFCCEGSMGKFQAYPNQYVNSVQPPNGMDISHTLRKGQ